MEAKWRRRTRLLLTLLLAFNIVVSVYGRQKRVDHAATAEFLCQGTLYTDLCASTVSSIPNLTLRPVSYVISSVVKRIVPDVTAVNSTCSGVRSKDHHLDSISKNALEDCLDLLSSTLDELTSAIADLSIKKSTSSQYHNIQTFLSAAITNQNTCLDGFIGNDSSARNSFKARLVNVGRHVSNSLSMLEKIKNLFPSKPRRGLSDDTGGGFPSWVSRNERRLLEASLASEIASEIVVAKDGSGNFTTVQDAVDVAPRNSKTRIVVYIKQGVYQENVEVGKNKMMLMFLGDGINKTIIKGNRSVVDGWTTFRSATVAVTGSKFIAKGVSFVNDAGPKKHQAVALRSGADLSTFYMCSFEGYQDTLYVHSLRQFFRECDVYGTVDFIFGNAAVVFQNCNLYARKPDENQKNIFTAQGREDPNQNTGISILDSRITAAPDLLKEKGNFSTYLGRPWKEYSRTVFMRSYIDDVVNPKGWLEWSGTFALDTLIYREYNNTGPGSNTAQRVKWAGYGSVKNEDEANLFTVQNFIEGLDWLGATNVPFSLV